VYVSGTLTFVEEEKIADCLHQSFMGSCSGKYLFSFLTLPNIKVQETNFCSRISPYTTFWSPLGERVVCNGSEESQPALTENMSEIVLLMLHSQSVLLVLCVLWTVDTEVCMNECWKQK
jgi:hypothetical protein